MGWQFILCASSMQGTRVLGPGGPELSPSTPLLGEVFCFPSLSHGALSTDPAGRRRGCLCCTSSLLPVTTEGRSCRTASRGARGVSVLSQEHQTRVPMSMYSPEESGPRSSGPPWAAPHPPLTSPVSPVTFGRSSSPCPPSWTSCCCCSSS